MSNVSADLLLLSAIAFSNKDYDRAGALYAQALSTDDSEHMLNSLNEFSLKTESSAVSTSANLVPSSSLSSIARQLAASMSCDEDDVYPDLQDDPNEVDDFEEASDSEVEDPESLLESNSGDQEDSFDDADTDSTADSEAEDDDFEPVSDDTSEDDDSDEGGEVESSAKPNRCPVQIL